MNYIHFKNIKNYSVYINNFLWNFSFNETKIIINNYDNYDICGSGFILYNVYNYTSYFDTFINSIGYINILKYCNICKTFDEEFCKICKLNQAVDNLPINFDEDCPICYNKLTVRYITICNDNRHKICDKCNTSKILKCPLCRINKYDENNENNQNNENNIF